LCGCTLHNAVSVTGSGSLAATPTGPGAVLKVTVPYNTQISARGADWGIIRTQNPDARFADILAAAAREDAGLDVTPRLKVAAALEEAGVDAGLHPDAAHLQDAARAAGCAYFLTVDVLRWQCDYVLFNASSTVEFDLTCRASAGARELWSVHVFCRSRALTDGEVARLALAEAFHWLQTNDPGAAATAPEARGP
jgi:hypothetical protein